MTPTTSFTFQLGDPVEHRGIVITPLFPARDPVAAYITLDEALPRGLSITEISDAGSVPELAVINPLDESVLLYDGEELVGAKQNRILNVSVLVGAGAKLPIPVSCVEQGRWNRSSVDFDSATHISHAHLRRRKAEMLAAQPLSPRRGAERGVERDRREAGAHVGRLAHRREPRHLRGVRRPAAQARGRVPAGARSVWRRARDRRCAVPGHRLPAGGVHACSGRSSEPGYLLDALERLDQRPADIERIAGFVDEVADAPVDPRRVGRARRGRAPARPRRDRLRPRARRRADPAERVHELGRRAAGVRADRAAEPAALAEGSPTTPRAQAEASRPRTNATHLHRPLS